MKYLPLLLSIFLIACQSDKTQSVEGKVAVIETNEVPEEQLETESVDENESKSPKIKGVTPCDITTLAYINDNLDSLTKDAIRQFLSTFSKECDNNVEFSQWSNELLFLVIQADVNLYMSVLVEDTPDNLELILKELDEPIMEFDLDEISELIKLSNAPTDLIEKHLHSISIAKGRYESGTATEYANAIEKFASITDMPYICRQEIGDPGCGQTEFWSVVQYKLEAVPYLIDFIDDSTSTRTAVPNFGGKYVVGDIAFQAIQEIISGIPTFELLGVEFDSDGCGYCSYWNYVRRQHSNRASFKTALSEWYDNNKDNLEWVESDIILTCDCTFGHPNGGHFKLRKDDK